MRSLLATPGHTSLASCRVVCVSYKVRSINVCWSLCSAFGVCWFPKELEDFIGAWVYDQSRL